MADMKVGLIGGSGLGEAVLARSEGRTRHEVDTPFGRPSDAIVETDLGGLPVFFLSRHGAGHVHGPSQVPFRANIFALKKLGVTHIIASGAVGSLRDEYKPRDLVIPDQVIDKTFRRAGTFFERSAVHVEFAEPFCPVLRRILIKAGEGSGFGVQGSGKEKERANSSDPSSPEPRTLNPESSSYNVHPGGCYVCMEGPAFSTRAESLMHRLWGGDLIGMTAMPEAKLAREAEMSYALVALVTDYDCWRRPPAVKPGGGVSPGPQGVGGGAAAELQDPYVLLQEIIANLRAASDNAIDLIGRALSRMSDRRDELMAAPARHALRLAVWSDKARIPRDEVELLAPLWMKYFEERQKAEG